ncbi:MAG: YhcH/YjgK/YiaL family protein [Muribaculaceae bacterium]|nr:YhcH/YjgK/YiaL family protein [Muribaculaceae bacterium]
MITGELNDTSLIEKLNPKFAIAFNWIRENLSAIPEMEPQKIVLIPNDLYINIEEIHLKERTEQLLEIHKKFIDIHVPISATELIGWVPSNKLQNPVSPYNDDLDRTLYYIIPSSFVAINTGCFCIMLPSDGHSPNIGTGILKKLCVKIRIED